MFNLDNYPQILNFFRLKSNIFKKISSREYMMFCPYCDDSTRKTHITHGHLYLSVQYPVFHCFRCEISGSLGRLLFDLNFSDNDILTEISKLTKFRFNKDYFQKPILNIKNNSYLKIKEKNQMIKEKDLNQYKIIEDYIFSRIGNLINYSDFGILINSSKDNQIIDFFNKIGIRVCSRFINNSEKRYKIHDKSQLYFFQSWDFEKYKNIVLTEGPFDAISLFLYNNIFKDSFFISINGKKYISVIERLLMTEFLFGKYKINCIFDNDVKTPEIFLKRSENIIKKINPNCEIFGWSPIIGKDTGDFPAVSRIF